MTSIRFDERSRGFLPPSPSSRGRRLHRAFHWQDGAFLDLGTLPGEPQSFGFAIEPGGAVAGSSKSGGSGNSERLTRVTDAGGLASLGGSGQHNQALAFNASLTVVGQLGESLARACAFTDAEGLRDPTALVDRSQQWVLQTAVDVNDARQIAGRADSHLDGRSHAVLLTPTTRRPPECGSRCLRSEKLRLCGGANGGRARVGAQVTVSAESGAAVVDALVTASWTEPDGSTRVQTVATGIGGTARFDTAGLPGESGST